jgi:hypothetical protein
MAITTYAELQSAIADTLNRDDLTSVVPNFISSAEANFQRQVRHWRMEARSSITLDAQFVDLPADWMETVKLTVSTASGPREIELISVAEMDDRRWQAGDTAGIPQVYAINAGQLELFPTPSESMTGSIVYVQKIPALSVSNTSNWLLENYVDAYLYGSLVHSAPYLQEDQRLTTWAALAQQAIDAINLDSDRAKYSGSGLRMKVRAY